MARFNKTFCNGRIIATLEFAGEKFTSTWVETEDGWQALERDFGEQANIVLPEILSDTDEDVLEDILEIIYTVSARSDDVRIYSVISRLHKLESELYTRDAEEFE